MPTPFARFVSVLLLGSLAVGCQREALPANATASTPAPVNVRLAPVEFSTASPPIRTAALLARQTEVDLAFPVAGLIAGVEVRAGDQVKRGQPLARLQPDQTEAQFIQATSALEKARRDLARLERLQKERVATLENLQDARTQLDQAAAALRVADFNRRHAEIAAPADGIVLRRLAEPNELVSAGQAVLTFASAGDGWIAKAGLAPRDVTRISLGAEVSVDDGTGGRARGKVARIAAATDTGSRTVPVEVQLETPPSAARSGLVVSLLITPREVDSRAVVPLAALRDGLGGRASLFVVNAETNAARHLPVEVEQIDGERAYLRTALAPGSRVVVTGAQYLSDGAAVKVIP
jgi:multidrug efflux system membrane fusion protein